MSGFCMRWEQRAASRMLVVREQIAYMQAMSPTLYHVEIRSWDWPLHVGVRPPSAAAERAPKGDLLCVEAVAIEGLVLAPEEHCSKLIHLGLSPLPREIIFGDGGEGDVGRLHKDPVERKDLGFYATLYLPEDTLQNVILCLSSKWRSIHMWVDASTEPSSITNFGFSGSVKLEPSP
jgi:hypothetical protein